MNGERAGGRAGRRILGDPERRRRTSASSIPCRRRRSSRCRRARGRRARRGPVEGGDRGLVRKPDEDVARAVLVDLDREERLVDAERGEQFVDPVVRLVREGGCVHPAEDRCRRALERIGRPRWVSSLTSSRPSVWPRKNARPSTGWPANGSSVPGVKIRIARVAAAPRAAGGRSSRRRSARGRCAASARARTDSASVKRPSWFPSSGVSVKTSRT